MAGLADDGIKDAEPSAATVVADVGGGCPVAAAAEEGGQGGEGGWVGGGEGAVDCTEVGSSQANDGQRRELVGKGGWWF